MSVFPPETFTFLNGIAARNEKAWFDANRDLYEAGFVAPAKAFVAELGPRLREISPSVQFEPKVNGSISRLNRDIRFSKDKRPYKEHLDLWFWHGGRRSWEVPGFWFSLTPQRVMLGVGLYRFDREQLESYRQSVIHPRSGKALVAAVAEVKAKGPYWIGEKTRKLMPRGYEADPSRAEYLLYDGLTAGIELPPNIVAQPDFLDRCVEHYAHIWPVMRWVLAEVAD